MRLADWLKANGKTATWLAGQVDRDPSFITRIKNGDAMPSIEVAAAIQHLTAGEVTAVDFVALPSAANTLSVQAETEAA